jgi:lipopolysaccharide/colanic/teichoic acid biosynthesis glycosyltransferase
VETIGEARDSQSALGWVGVNGRATGLAQPVVRGLRMKRGLDITISIVLLILLVPVFIFVALTVRLSSPGPIVFVQPRLGKNGRSFAMYKFRTMLSGGDSAVHRAYVRDLIRGAAEPRAGAFKLSDDRRVTPVGRFLRRYSLDELPQLLNVLRGEMSLVGPRPPLYYEVEMYSTRDHVRLSVSPGLTGLWQVSGRSELTFQQMIDLDLEYVERWSVWLDFKILCRTPLVVITGRGAC